MSLQLNQENLSQVSTKLTSPSYDRSGLKTGIVHIGVGGFHRAHQAVYMHQLFESNKALDWAITGVGLREFDRKMYEVLLKQDGLYTMVVQSADDSINSEIIGSIKEMLLAVDTPDKVLQKMTDDNTKIISLTITEGGYNFNPNTGDFNFENPDVKHDLENPDAPKSVFGYLTKAFVMRKQNNAGGLTIFSCDNVQHNGNVTKKVILDFAKRQRPKLIEWIENNVTFPNSMVDRITPKTAPETIKYLKDNYDLEDEFPVNCEPFIQWVIEDNFAKGRPPLEDVGAQFVSDVTPYEEMKLRLLNAGHSFVGITGAIHGHGTIYECLADKTLAKFLRQYLDEEATPMLDPVEGIDVEAYKDSLIERFGNPNIKDTVARICEESSAKLPKFVIPTIQDNLKKDGKIELGALLLATWCYYSAEHKNEKGEDLDIKDEMSDELHQQAKKSKENPLAFLNIDEVFGDLKNQEKFTNTFTQILNEIYEEQDILKVINKYIS